MICSEMGEKRYCYLSSLVAFLSILPLLVSVQAATDPSDGNSSFDSFFFFFFMLSVNGVVLFLPVVSHKSTDLCTSTSSATLFLYQLYSSNECELMLILCFCVFCLIGSLKNWIVLVGFSSFGFLVGVWICIGCSSISVEWTINGFSGSGCD